MRTTYPGIANKIIEWGILFLIVFTPIAIGTVHPWAYTIMELTICFLVIIWIVRLAMININKTTPFPGLQSPIPGPDRRADRTRAGSNRQSSIDNHKSQSLYSTVLVNRFGFIKTPLTIPMILFVGLVLFQLAPLPPGVLKILSPNTYKLYKTTLPDWQDGFQSTIGNRQSAISNLPKSTNQQINESAISHQPPAISHQPSTSKSWQSISVYRHATRIELYKILSYMGIFFLIVNYNPSTGNRQPVTRGHRLRIKTLITRLIIVLIIVGSFESIYGLLECLGGYKHILLMKNVFNPHAVNFVTGTYINLNHFSGYMAIVICISFGYLTYLSSKIPGLNVTRWRQKLVRMINLIGTRAGLLSFLILVMSAALILSGSRMGICSFITAVILMSIMISKKVSIKKMLLIILPICLMAIWIGLNPVIKKFSHTFMDIEAEGRRTQIWKDTFNLIKDYPVLGTGLGTYEYTFPKYKTIEAQKRYDHAHNDYLELISDMGFAGFIIVITGIVWYLFIVVKMWYWRRNSFVRGVTAGCLGGIAYIILHSFTDFNLQIPANALNLSIISGIMHKTITQL